MTTTVEGVAIDTVGVILMSVGFIGILISMLFLMSFSPFSRTTSTTRVVDEPVDHTHV